MHQVLYYVLYCVMHNILLRAMHQTIHLVMHLVMQHRFIIDSEFHCYSLWIPFIPCSEYAIWRGVAPEVFCEAQESGEKLREKQPKKGLKWSGKSGSSLVVAVSIGTVVWRSCWERWVLRQDLRTRLELGIIIQASGTKHFGWQALSVKAMRCAGRMKL